MTLSDVARMDAVYITPTDVASVINVKPQAIRVMASTVEGRQGLGFPVIRIGADTKIPRIPFLRFMGWEGKIEGAEA